MQNVSRKLASYLDVLSYTRDKRNGLGVLSSREEWERRTISDAFFNDIFMSTYYPGVGTFKKGASFSFARDLDFLMKRYSGSGIQEKKRTRDMSLMEQDAVMSLLHIGPHTAVKKFRAEEENRENGC